jgi:hypothetical protein
MDVNGPSFGHIRISNPSSFLLLVLALMGIPIAVDPNVLAFLLLSLYVPMGLFKIPPAAAVPYHDALFVLLSPFWHLGPLVAYIETRLN